MQPAEEKFAVAAGFVVLGQGNPAPYVKVRDFAGEKPIGNLLLGLRKEWIVLEKMVTDYNREDDVVKLHNQKVNDMSSLAEKSDHHLLISDHERAFNELKCCAKYFWRGVRDSFPEIDLANQKIGLRVDWVVVIIPGKPVDELLSESP